MYLKKIEIKGFKSFADPVVLDFERGLNAIVGPNGSGKSNIIEAVRWVLGEQSAKQLRGDKMQDIIFNGTSKRRPMNYATVTMVIDNHEHHLPLDTEEVTITRQLSRQGDSHYELNGTLCRLKDIHDLFTDSGVGRQSLSIISQGKVEAIFDVKPENRRQLFEEAAGVLKYKQRKIQTEKKLNDTDEHMDRLDDILYELNEQLTPLKAQCETYMRYEQLNQEYETVHIQYMTKQLETKKQAVEQITQTLAQNKENYRELNDRYSDVTAQYDEMLVSKERYEKDAVDVQNRYIEAVKKAEKLRFNMDLFYEKERHQEESEKELAKQKLLLDSDLMSLIEKKAALATKQKELKQTLANKKKEEKQLTDVLTQLTSYHHVSTEQLRDDYFEVMQQLASINNEWQEIDNRYLRLGAKKERYDLEEKQWLEQKAKITATINEYQLRLEMSQEKLREKEKEQATLQAKWRHLTDKIKEKEKQQKQAEKQLHQLQASIASLNELLSNRSLYYKGPREVLANPTLHGIVGSVVDLISVEPKYITAIETALGASIQHIIVETEEDAKAAITFLQKENKGQATFLPQNTVKATALDDELIQKAQKEDGFIGIAADLVETTEDNKEIIRFLLGQTIIVTTLDAATHLAKILRYKVKIITLDGSVVQKGGALTGGSRQTKGTLLQQKEELNEKKAQYERFDKTYQTFEIKMSELYSEKETMNTQLEQVHKEVQEEEIFVTQAQKLLTAAKDDEQQLSKKHDIATLTPEDIDLLQSYDQRKKEYHKQKDALLSEQTRLQQAMETSRLADKERQEKEKQSLEEKYALQSEIKVIKQTLHQYEEDYRQYIEEENKINGRKAVLIEREQQQPIQTQEDVKQLEDELDQTENNIRILKEKQESLQQRQANNEQQMVTLTKEKEMLVRQRHDIEVSVAQQKEQLDKYNEQMDQWLDKLSQTYTLTYEAAVKQYGYSHDEVSVLKEKMKQLKQSLNDLGPINMEAKLQYEEVNQRYQTMKEQRDDLIEAKETLLSTIGEMDMEVKHRFKETFIAIEESFSQLFPKMFDGGQAHLSLTNPDDLLQTGIEINVQPPGKKVKSLSLLSGGERALTAITLLLAIIQVKPVPFCILDEVEAALDEVNVVRFSRYLKQVADRQFIVVTHRKGTMEMADALYGVTMEEDGVSKLVSVKLEEIHD